MILATVSCSAWAPRAQSCYYWRCLNISDMYHAMFDSGYWWEHTELSGLLSLAHYDLMVERR